jgi:hypothetical protein
LERIFQVTQVPRCQRTFVVFGAVVVVPDVFLFVVFVFDDWHLVPVVVEPEDPHMILVVLVSDVAVVVVPMIPMVLPIVKLEGVVLVPS